MNESNVWSKSFELDVCYTPEKIWHAFIDTANWKQWNPGVKSIHVSHRNMVCDGAT